MMDMKRIVLVIAAAMILFHGCTPEIQRRVKTSPVKDSLLVEYMRYASQFSDCSFVDWNGFSRIRVMQSFAYIKNVRSYSSLTYFN